MRSIRRTICVSAHLALEIVWPRQEDSKPAGVPPEKRRQCLWDKEPTDRLERSKGHGEAKASVVKNERFVPTLTHVNGRGRRLSHSFARSLA